MPRTWTLEQQLPAVDADEDLRTLSEGLADEHPEVREQCAQRLAALKDPEAAPFLRHALDDDSEQVRVWGAYGLGILAREEDRTELERAAQSDESPLVRIWAQFGLCNLGLSEAGPRLCGFLDLPDLELRSNAADAILSLRDVSSVRPLLDRRLASPDGKKRTWAAAILHRWGHAAAFAAWRDALVDPQTRVDAAMAASHLRVPAAARELVRVTAELTAEELRAPQLSANDLPLAEVLTSPLLELDLARLTQDARDDAAVRADLLLILLRSAMSDPEVLAILSEFAASLDPEALGSGVAELLSEQAPDDRPFLLARMVEFSPDAVLPALAALDGSDRDALLAAVLNAAQAPGEGNASLAPLFELLRHSRYADAFSSAPTSPWGEEPDTDLGVETVAEPAELDETVMAEMDALADEDDLALVVERMVAGDEVPAEQRKQAESMLADLGMTAEEFVASLADDAGSLDAEPPEPEQVALRALALGALQERARIEEEAKDGKLPATEALAAQKALVAWLEGESIQDVLTPLELDLVQAEPGDWLDEDMELVDASTEALAMILWALGQLDLPAADRQVDPPLLMKKLPLLSATEKFVARALLRPAEELEPLRELYETLLWRTEQESTARVALSGEEVDPGIDLDAVLPDLEKDGFDAQKASQKGGEGAVVAEALRFLGRKAAAQLAEEGRLSLAKGDFAFEGRPLSAIADAELSLALALAQERHRALSWVLSGGDWDGLSLDEDLELG